VGVIGGVFTCANYFVRVAIRAADAVSGTDTSPGLVAAESTGVKRKWTGGQLRVRPTAQKQDDKPQDGSSKDHLRHTHPMQTHLSRADSQVRIPIHRIYLQVHCRVTQASHQPLARVSDLVLAARH